MASEVPTHELNALVTCGLFLFKKIFTLEPLKEGVTLTQNIFSQSQSQRQRQRQRQSQSQSQSQSQKRLI